MTVWTEAQEFERNWWGSCSNTFQEEIKQLTYAHKMGLTAFSSGGHWPVYDLQGKSVLDIGGGPVSILLKCINLGICEVADPCEYPSWVRNRYERAGIIYNLFKGEDLPLFEYDEVWIYNVLQHVEDPELIIHNAKRIASTIRIFEWIDMAPSEGHPQELKEEELNKWLGGQGTTEWLDENGCNGRSFYGVFSI
jgi:2-polyprenyl-3-methyl-5-hydroxy-6-metoxy-1,4-benzoquinol methylase